MKFFASPKPGLHHTRWSDSEKSVQARLHLRIHPDGTGVFSVNANRYVQLNHTATEIAWHFMERHLPAKTIKAMVKRYRIDRISLKKDVETLYSHLKRLAQGEDLCFDHDTNLVSASDYETVGNAPLRMDLVLTYGCQNRCSHCYNPPQRAKESPDHPPAFWEKVLQRLAEVGVPHVVFTGGEATLRQDLPRLVARAEKLGLMTGLNTHGRRLGKDPAYLQSLVEAGLDHIQVTVESPIAATHNAMVGAEAFEETMAGFDAALSTPIFTMTNTTLSTLNASSAPDLVDFLAKRGAHTMAVNGMIFTGGGACSGTDLALEETRPILQEMASRAASSDMTLLWYTPTRYCELNPLELGLGLKQCTAARISMAIEPDGAVLPCQSYYTPVGHILNDPWEKVWNHPLCQRLRHPHTPLAECESCPDLSLCAGGCPLETSAREAARQGETKPLARNLSTPTPTGPRKPLGEALPVRIRRQ